MDCRHRPTYHFLPPKNWMNDPNGLLCFNGKFHMFYQYNPDETVFKDDIKWGHAVSTDLVYWKHLPIALRSDKFYDKYGCWSGMAVINNGVPTILYIGAQHNEQLRFSHTPCIATGKGKDLVRWEKHPDNPIKITPLEPIFKWANKQVVYSDTPFAWREGKTWYIILAAKVAEDSRKKGILWLFKSHDLINWQYLHPLFDWNGDMLVCPNFFRLGSKWVLIVTPLHGGKTIYFVGNYKDHKFKPEFQGEIDLGGSFFAAQVFKDPTGRHIMFGWLREMCSQRMSIKAGWCGVMSLPRILTLNPDGRLNFEPAPELKILRGKHKQFSNINVTSAAKDYLPGVSGDCLEIMTELAPNNTSKVGLKLRSSPEAAEETLVYYDSKTHKLVVDCRRSSKSTAAHKGTVTAKPLTASKNIHSSPFYLSKGENLKLHIFLDRSVVEVYANGNTCLSCRIYPSQKNSVGVNMFAKGGDATAVTMDICTTKAIWKH